MMIKNHINRVVVYAWAMLALVATTAMADGVIVNSSADPCLKNTLNFYVQSTCEKLQTAIANLKRPQTVQNDNNPVVVAPVPPAFSSVPAWQQALMPH